MKRYIASSAWASPEAKEQAKPTKLYKVVVTYFDGKQIVYDHKHQGLSFETARKIALQKKDQDDVENVEVIKF